MGQIVTFYSYKGGTGRSMALANVAWALATNGHKVLVIDWDLEAPGLHRYFRGFLSDKELTEPESKGLIEFVRNYATLAATPLAEGKRDLKWYEPHAQIWKWAIPLRWPRDTILNFGSRGEIQLVPAGRQGPDYAERINTFDWHQLYQNHGGDKFFQSVREQAKVEFDYVLIDSRTGVSDTSGVCTIQMPDILVVCYTYNLQSIMGASDITRRVLNKRPDLAIFPVAMRVEFTETDLLIPMRKLARTQFGNLVPEAKSDGYFDKTEVPYYPKYSFFERLAAFEEFPNAKGSINADVRHLAYLIADREIVQTPIDEKRRLDVTREFDPAAVDTMPDVSPRPAWSLPPRFKWAALAWAVVFPLLILLLFIAWKHVPRPEGISVSVDPPTATLAASDQLQLVATVRGSNNTNVIWTAALGKIDSSGLYVAPRMDPNQSEAVTETITATSTVDRSQSGTALLKITEQSRFLVKPVSATLKPGESQVFSAEFKGDNVKWQVSPPEIGSLVGDGDTGSYTAPEDLAKRQRIVLTVSSSSNDALASAGINLSPETSPLGRWAYLILVTAAGALGGYLSATQAVVFYLGNRVLRTDWWLAVATRPLFGACAGLVSYFSVIAILGPNQNTSMLAAIAGIAGFFMDQVVTTLRKNFDVLLRGTGASEKSP